MNFKLLYVVTFLVLLIVGNAQTLQYKDGAYVDYNSMPFSGLYEETYDNGNKKLEMHLINGLQDSCTIMYFENGTINEKRCYKAGKMDGVWETFNEQGIKVAEAGYANDKKNGVWKIWDNNGILLYEMYYTDGQKTGLWKVYNENGELINQRQY